ncbi:hypothetical protein BKA61DRAFT_676494 [Leptodontidium sp. MPI-SDFR-AT-0119]|nr:hypothetical protein BKA61DRAFT_676494 [Leptodontidium sp. MPI-SDFR-AT-0119]
MANQSKLAKDDWVFRPRQLSALKRVKKALIGPFTIRSKNMAGVCTGPEGEREDEVQIDVKAEAKDNIITKQDMFERFLNLPTELQDQIWGYYMVLDHIQRDIHVNLTLRKLPKNLNPNDAKSPIRYAPSLIYTTPSAPPPPLFSISHASRNFAIKNSPYKFAIPLPLPSSGPGVTKTNTITRLIPLDFTIGDKLTITFPFHSEALFSWIAFHLSPGFTKYIKRPIEVVGELERDDRRVLKAAGALVAKRKRSWGWLRRGERRTVVTFKLCEVWEGLDIGVDEIGGGRVVERLRGVPVGVWDRMWMRLMEKLEVEGGGLTDDF